MFSTLDQAKEWVQAGGPAVPHTAVPGELDWLAEQMASLEDDIARLTPVVEEQSRQFREAKAAWEQEAVAWRQDVRERPDSTRAAEMLLAERRQRDQVEELKQQLRQARATQARQGSPEVAADAGRLVQEHADRLRAAKARLGELARERTLFLNPGTPNRPSLPEDFPGPDLAAAQTDLRRLQAFAASADDPNPLPAGAADRLRKLLVAQAALADQLRTAVTDLFGAAGEDPDWEVLRVLRALRCGIVDDTQTDTVLAVVTGRCEDCR